MIKFVTSLVFSATLLLTGLLLAAQESMPEPNWSLSKARAAALQVDTQAALKPLFRLAREGNDAQLLQALSEIEQRSD